MPLSGVFVLDLTRLLPGPYATRLFAELGATVVKVEDPQGGDYARWAPPLAGDPPASGLFRELNRGKRSVALDLKQPAAQAALRKLAARADVLCDSFRPGVLARLGLDPRALMEANPRLIYCALTGFGLTGPDALRAGHDIGYNARAGVLGVSGTAESPAVLGAQLADIGGALSAVAGVLAALYERTRTGRGRVVDISLTEAALAFNAAAFGGLHAGERPRRGEQVLDGSRPCYGVYQTKDGRHLAVGALEPKFWSAFVQAIGLPELAACGLDTGAAGQEVRARVQARLRERTRAEWSAVFRQVEACVEPVLELDEVEADVHHQARGLAIHGFVRGPLRLTGWEGLGAAGRPLSDAPELGAHTAEVLREVGVDEATLAALT